ncbi:unannotated protein [freshwater metagenome]|uniref:Unannotated protein n=1 Tax=freshwater metagenome TaxID=449393 RepID=A0A6J7H8K7_9ZZZZ
MACELFRHDSKVVGSVVDHDHVTVLPGITQRTRDFVDNFAGSTSVSAGVLRGDAMNSC